MELKDFLAQYYEQTGENDTLYYKYNRGVLPHLGYTNGLYAVTIRLADSVPDDVQDKWRRELEILNSGTIVLPEKLTDLKIKHSRDIGDFLDKGEGDCILKQPEVAQIVVNTLNFYDHKDYMLLAWSVMPNHLHFVIQVLPTVKNPDGKLGPIVKRIKTFTTGNIRELLHTTQKIWMNDYFDRYIRNKKHLINVVKYVLNNPRKIGASTEFTGSIFEEFNKIINKSGTADIDDAYWNCLE